MTDDDLIAKLRDQNYRLWCAGQRVCNGNSGAVEELGRVLDSCRPPNDLGAAPLDPDNPMAGF